MKRKFETTDIEKTVEPPAKKTKVISEESENKEPNKPSTDSTQACINEKEPKQTNDSGTNQIDEKILNLVNKHSFYDEDKEKLSIEKVSLLSDSRSKIYESKYKAIASAECVLSVSLKDDDDEYFERIVLINKNDKNEYTLTDKLCDCSIGALCEMDQFSPSGFIEFCFEDSDKYYLAPVCVNCLEYYKSQKFDIWKKMIKETTCEATLRRLLQIGLITKVFDSQLFPIPEQELADYQVVDKETGKTINIPRPCKSLRIWDVEESEYEEIDAILKGAPKEKDAEKYWNDLVQELKDLHGSAEYIEKLMNPQKNANEP